MSAIIWRVIIVMMIDHAVLELPGWLMATSRCCKWHAAACSSMPPCSCKDAVAWALHLHALNPICRTPAQHAVSASAASLAALPPAPCVLPSAECTYPPPAGCSSVQLHCIAFTLTILNPVVVWASRKHLPSVHKCTCCRPSLHAI